MDATLLTESRCFPLSPTFACCCCAAEESSSEGWVVADKLHLAAEGSSGNGSNSSSSRAVEVVFGCENMETGEIYKQRVDGVLGMGNNVNSLPRQVGVTCQSWCAQGVRLRVQGLSRDLGTRRQ